MPGLEVEFDKFMERVEEQTADPEWQLQNHPAQKTLDKYDPAFGHWVERIHRLSELISGGCPFGQNDLTSLEWRALGALARERERLRDQLALPPRQG